MYMCVVVLHELVDVNFQQFCSKIMSSMILRRPHQRTVMSLFVSCSSVLQNHGSRVSSQHPGIN